MIIVPMFTIITMPVVIAKAITTITPIAITITITVVIVIDCMGLVPVSFCRKVYSCLDCVYGHDRRTFTNKNVHNNSDGDKSSYNRFIRLITIKTAI